MDEPAISPISCLLQWEIFERILVVQVERQPSYTTPIYTRRCRSIQSAIILARFKEATHRFPCSIEPSLRLASVLP
jgi:hypothetical protein